MGRSPSTRPARCSSAPTPRPVAGPDDGLLNWLGDPAGYAVAQAAQPDPVDLVEHLVQPGQNPYCPGCFSAPVPWASVPGETGIWEREGYGSVDPPSVALAGRVLRGEVALPERPVEDALYAADQDLRNLWWFHELPAG